MSRGNARAIGAGGLASLLGAASAAGAGDMATSAGFAAGALVFLIAAVRR